MSGGWILSIDQGTTGTRSMVVDSQGSPVALRYRKHRQITPQPGWVEHDPEEIWRSVELTAAAALKEVRIRPSDLAGIGIANQGETVMAWDAQTSRPVANAIVWQCDRTRRSVERLKQNGNLAKRIHRISGLVPDCYFSASKMRWLYQHVPECRTLARSGRLRMGTLDSWLIWKLSRGRCFITDTSTASRTLLMDLRHQQWSSELLQLFRIRQEWLPPVASTAGDLGTAILAGTEVPILASAVDQQSALFGQCCFHSGSAKCTFGTGAFLLMHTGAKPVYSRKGLLTTIATATAANTTYALDGGVYVAGAAISWMRENLRMLASDAEAAALAESVPDTGGVTCVPSLAGLAAPWWERRARGLICGLTGATTRAHIIRAILEGIALQVYTVAQLMSRESGQALHSPLRVDGGLTRNAFLMRFLAGLLECELAVPPCDETTALGVGWMAGIQAGLFTQKDLESGWKAARLFEPAMPAAERAALISNHGKAIRRLLEWSRNGG